MRPTRRPGPVVIDCCPLLNVLSLNAIFAADLVLVPVSADFLSLKGAEQVERALNALEPVFKRRLPRRYLLTRYDARRRMTDEVEARMRELLREDEICRTVIRENVKLAESPAVGLDVFRHAPGSRGAQDYDALYEELQGAGFLAIEAAGADEADDAVDVERLEAARYALLLAIDDHALVIHLAQAAFGVGLRGRHDQDVFDPLAMSGPDIESVANHDLPPIAESVCWTH